MKQLRVINPDSWRGTAFILIVSVSARMLLFFATQAWPVTPDGAFHLQRVRALTEAWSQGLLYPRWFPDFAFGYGHPILHYYAPLTYVGPAVLHVLGMDVLTATRLGLALIYGTSGLVAYWAVRPWLAPGGALTVDLLYLAFPYRLYDLFVRGALAEFAAFFWMPLLLGAMLRLILAEKLNRTQLCVAAIAWAGLALTHNLTLLMVAILTIIAIPLAALHSPAHPTVIQSTVIQSSEPTTYLQRLRTVVVRSALAAALGALLSAFYTVPALLDARWVGIGSIPSAGGYLDHFAGWNDLIQWQFRYAYPGADLPTVPLSAPWLTVVIAGLILLIRVRRRSKLRVALPLGALIFAMWLTTAWSGHFWSLVAPVLGKLQFPWRWQTLAALPFALVGGLVVDALVHSRRNWQQLSLALLVGFCATWIALPRSLDRTVPTITRPEMWAFDAAQGQIGATWTGEFLPRWVQTPRWAIGQPANESTIAQTQETATAADLDVALLAQSYLNNTYRIMAQSPVTLTFDQFYFPAWRVTLDHITATTAPQGELGLLGVVVPEGTHRLTLAWRPTSAVWLGRLLSTLGWLIVAYLFWRVRRKRAFALWMLIGGIAVTGMMGLTQRRDIPTPIAADYGSVKLLGATTTPTAPGTLAAVRLDWLLRDAAVNSDELVVFVHVVAANDPTNAVVAQWDEPIGGPYRPPSRWATPQLLHQTIHVPLSPDLPTGDYRVLGGVYRAGAPEAPLQPAGPGEARQLMATLHVRNSLLQRGRAMLGLEE